MDLHNLHRYGSSGSRATQFWPHASDVPSSEKIWYSSAPRITPNEGKTMEIKREDIHIHIYIYAPNHMYKYMYIYIYTLRSVHLGLMLFWNGHAWKHLETLDVKPLGIWGVLDSDSKRPGRTSVASPARNAVRSRTISTARPSIAELKTVVRGPRREKLAKDQREDLWSVYLVDPTYGGFSVQSSCDTVPL